MSSGAREDGKETEMTKEEEEERASAALFALRRRYRTPQELEENLRRAYSALDDCADECLTDILLHITHSGRLLEEGAEMREAEFDANFAALQLENFIEDPDAYRAEMKEIEEQLEREENDPSLTPPAPVKPESLPDTPEPVSKVWYFICSVLAVLITGGIVYFTKPATNPTPASSSPNAAVSARQEEGADANGATGQALNFAIYRNSRFGYAISYPEAFLIPQPESLNGDGRTFSSRDGSARLTCWGAVLPDGSDIQMLYQRDLQTHPDITYKVRRLNWYVISGMKNHRIYYEKAIFGPDSYAAFLIEIPQSAKRTYVPIVARLSRTFVFSQEPAPLAGAGQAEQQAKANAPRVPRGLTPLLLEFRGLHAGQSRAEVESALRAQNWTMNCKAPERDGSVDCKCNLAFCNLDFSPEDKLWHFSMMLGLGKPISPQSIYQEVASVLGPGTSPHDSGLVEKLNKQVGGQEFDWDRGAPVPCSLDPEKDCPSQRLALYLAPGSANIELWDYQHIAKSQGIVKLDPNRPRPTVNKAFVLFGLEGGEARADTETTLTERGYSTPACKYDSEDLTNKCDTINGTYSLSLEFFQNRLVSFTLNFPKSEWERQVQLFKATLGEPTDAEKRTNQGVVDWGSTQTIPCVGEVDKQCTAEVLMLSINNEDATGRALYLYMPLENEVTVERAQRMTQGQ